MSERVAVTSFWAHWKHHHGAESRGDEASLRAEVARAKEGAADLAVVIGSSKGDLCGLANGDFPFWAPDAEAARWARELNAPLFLSPNAACATGAHAIALGARLIQDGDAKIVVAGAVEPPQHPLVLAAYKQMGALSKSGVMRPFDRARDGFVAASGGGMLLLEAESHAIARGATIHGFVSGWSLKCDATHLTGMDESGQTVARAMQEALRRAGNPTIGYLNAHGTATRLNDAVESRAIEAIFGSDVAVSSTKGITGHLLGAAGAVEAVLCLEVLQTGVLPPNIGLEEADEAINLTLVRDPERLTGVNAALSLNYGFGGHIGVLILEKS